MASKKPFKGNATGMRIKVNGIIGRIQSDLSSQYTVRLPGRGSVKFIHKVRDSYTILPEEK